ncbi:APC family permease [Acidobacteria bacterium AB60]|nr:APC family permease [Acidobacteria bacterium AB60]
MKRDLRLSNRSTAVADPRSSDAEHYGLHRGALGAAETLAQSISATAPSTSSSLTIPLVFAIAGNGTWLVYLTATVAALLVGFCISRFARMFASPGSLYSYTAQTLPPVFGVVSAWGLLLAYIATGASVAGGALYYVDLLSHQFLHATPPAIVTLAVICSLAGYVAFRDVRLSAEVMLWIEVASLAMVIIVFAVLLFRVGIHADLDQLKLRGVHFGSLGPALVLSMFSFVGFESATTLGAEARNPLRTIPRAVLQCALLAGAFFILSAYSEVLGFRGVPTNLADTSSPLHILAAKAGVSALGIGIDLGALISMFACVLACATAAARVTLRMSHAGLVPQRLIKTNKMHGTPGLAILICSLLMFLATAIMAGRGVPGFDIYDLAGSLSVFGFLTAYALVAVAVPFAEKAAGKISVPVIVLCGATVLVIVMIALFDLRSSTDAVHARIPFLYLGYMVCGLVAYIARRPRAR